MAPDPSSHRRHRHRAVVLFYKYFPSCDFPLLHQHAAYEYYEPKLLEWQKSLCQRLQLKGRVLLSAEGINGTLSATSMDNLNEYIQVMEQFELIRDCGLPLKKQQGEPQVVLNEDNDDDDDDNDNHAHRQYRLFRNVDWKKSTCSESSNLPEPFPDLKVSVVKEIISTGNNGVHVDEISRYGGQHLDPADFHDTLQKDPNVVLIDVRNTFECDIGHFVNPHTDMPALNPQMVQFSSFDDTFCAKQAAALKDKKVLMYCTGGVRCEKASVMLKRRGVQNVFQLKGGIHRYLEEYGDKGYFRGMNFVFDQRIAMTPSECQNAPNVDDRSNHHNNDNDHNVVGRCVSCQTAFDGLCGSRICTVCRDPVLVCRDCQKTLREYHCRRHEEWNHCYFTFLEVFTRKQLVQHRSDLVDVRKSLTNKNMRRTLMRQVEKVDARIRDLDAGVVSVDLDAPRRCRTCMEPNFICNGKCWGFWRATNHVEAKEESTPAIRSIQIGDIVEPGPNWNPQRLGTPTKDIGGLRCGKVVEVKSWGSGGSDLDSVMVQWNHDSIPSNRRSDRVPQIYRWGVVAVDGSRLYDVQKTYTASSSIVM